MLLYHYHSGFNITVYPWAVHDAIQPLTLALKYDTVRFLIIIGISTTALS